MMYNNFFYNDFHNASSIFCVHLLLNMLSQTGIDQKHFFDEKSIDRPTRTIQIKVNLFSLP